MELELEEQRRIVLETVDRLTEARTLYMQGLELVEQNQPGLAGEWIARAAEMGDPPAQCQLGYLYENGFFGELNPREAARWYRMSAEQSFPHAQFRLAGCYQSGAGVEKDPVKAAHWFELAARRGHIEAAECLQLLRAAN